MIMHVCQHCCDVMFLKRQVRHSRVHLPNQDVASMLKHAHTPTLAQLSSVPQMQMWTADTAGGPTSFVITPPVESLTGNTNKAAYFVQMNEDVMFSSHFHSDQFVGWKILFLLTVIDL